MDIEQARFNMVEQQIRPCEIFDKTLLDLLSSVKRENFVPVGYKDMAFSDVEIPLPGGQKMLLPRIVAKLIQELAIKKTDKILEIATGSGYVTALLAKMAEFVYSVEVSLPNKEFAVKNLTYAGINNVSVVAGDGANGLPAKAPYDKIFIGGGLLTIPEGLKASLRIGGILVGFVGNAPVMHAVKIVRVSENEYSQEQLFETVIDYLEGAIASEFKF